jgi:O-antigen biosynthesis protein WbqP
MKRFIDIVLTLAAGALLLLPCLLIALVVKLGSRGPVLYWSDRVGRGNALFKMPKFRSMFIDAPTVATHLLEDPQRWVTPVGRFLRRTSLDELPQLLCILKGDMSLVGPRPALFNQHDLIALRTEAGVHELRPGLTGWAQINGRDELSIPDKVAYDAWYARNQSLALDAKILLHTLVKVSSSQGVSH